MIPLDPAGLEAAARQLAETAEVVRAYLAAAGRAAATPDPPDEAAIRADERERLSARVYENGWCPTCATPAASPDERLREALERIVDLPLVDDSDADRMREIAAEALPWKPGSDDPR